MKTSEYLLVESTLSSEPPNNSKHYWVNSGEIFYDSRFFEQLHLEKLRAQGSKSTLSIILLTLEKETDGVSINMSEILEFIRTKTRNTDISGFVNHRTIGVLLPHTDEKGAKEICVKLVKGNNNNSQFSATTCSYPDHLFESLAKKGSIRPDAFLFELKDSKEALWIKLVLKRSIDIVGSIIGKLALMPVMIITALAIKVTSGACYFQANPLASKAARSHSTNFDPCR